MIFIAGILLLMARFAFGAECSGDSTCVSSQDMSTFVKVLKEKKCLLANQPSFQLDPVTIITDKEGRIYTSGTPYHVRMTWCSYDVQADGIVKAVAAIPVPREYGFRFRPKAYVGYLPIDALKAKDAGTGLDAGLLLDFAYWHWLNLNAAVGVRSGGAVVGFDVTRNFGLHIGYGLTWGSWQHNPQGGIWFAF